MASDAMTVGALRRAIEGLPDDTPIQPIWHNGDMPNDFEPGVSIHGFKAENGQLSAFVSLFYLNDDEECCIDCGGTNIVEGTCVDCEEADNAPENHE